MNRILTCGLLAALGVVASLCAGDRTRPAPKPALPAWLAPTTPRETTYSTQYLSARAAAVEPDARPLVWVVDGAGDFRGCSQAMSHANTLAGNPAEIMTFAWSHGYGRMLLDQIDQTHAHAQGARLAAKVLERTRTEPGRRVTLAGHSAGCAVVLAAAESLPPDSIDRIILLAPSVSTGYDLRPALRSAREGVDVFCSKKDWLALGFVTRVVGTTDRPGAAAAGRYGFDVPAGDRLRQHFWTPEMATTGHTGGHHGVYAAGFIHAYLFPLIGARGPN